MQTCNMPAWSCYQHGITSLTAASMWLCLIVPFMACRATTSCWLEAALLSWLMWAWLKRFEPRRISWHHKCVARGIMQAQKCCQVWAECILHADIFCKTFHTRRSDIFCKTFHTRGTNAALWNMYLRMTFDFREQVYYCFRHLELWCCTLVSHLAPSCKTNVAS